MSKRFALLSLWLAFFTTTAFARDSSFGYIAQAEAVDMPEAPPSSDEGDEIPKEATDTPEPSAPVEESKASSSREFTTGIYLTQSSLENTSKFERFLRRAKEVGISTFVIDLEKPSKRYAQNAPLLKQYGVRYVARIVMFPNGGHADQVQSAAYWQKRYSLVEAAVSYGADEIQLDYIRYTPKQRASSKNAEDIHTIISWYKKKLEATKTPLQIDVFGEVSFGPSRNIGQDLQVFAGSIDTACPMLYPSHFEPYVEHARTPYQTLDRALKALYAQFPQGAPFKVVPYIELFNYRYPLGQQQRREYIKAQIKAIKDNNADGWFAWSAGNKYDHFFDLLAEEQTAGNRLTQKD